MYRIFLFGALVLAGAVIAFQIGSRLEDETIMLLTGAVCGILASVPVVLGVYVLLTRERSYAPPPAQPVTRPYIEAQWIVIDPHRPAPPQLTPGSANAPERAAQTHAAARR